MDSDGIPSPKRALPNNGSYSLPLSSSSPHRLESLELHHIKPKTSLYTRNSSEAGSELTAPPRVFSTFRPLSFRESVWIKDPGNLVLHNPFAETEQPEIYDPPHHIFGKWKKRRLVWLISLAGVMSPLSSNIYFPAMLSIAQALHTTVALVALTISIYMIFQGLAPSFWGPLADSYGRRPILIATLTVYLAANVGLALSNTFAALMFFRAIQAIGSSSTISIGNGVIADVASGSERGGFVGDFGGIRMFGQAMGPVLGGVLSQYLGFRSIFYFLFGFTALVIILLIVYLPETLRKIAGDGSKPLYGIYKPLTGHSRQGAPIPKEERYKPMPLSFSKLFESFKLLAEKDVFCQLLFGGIIYTVWSMITSSTPSLWREEYGLTDIQIGLAFIPNGLGCVFGSTSIGKLLDWDYTRETKRYIDEQGLPEGTEIKQQDHPDFPVERARLQRVVWLWAIFVGATATYGFSVEWHIAFPLTLQFLTGFTQTAIFVTNSTLLTDLYPNKGASASAINNLVRCTLGAIGVGFIEKSITAIDESWTFLALAGICLVSVGFLIIERVQGPRWRKERFERIKTKNQEDHDLTKQV